MAAGGRESVVGIFRCKLFDHLFRKIEISRMKIEHVDAPLIFTEPGDLQISQVNAEISVQRLRNHDFWRSKPHCSTARSFHCPLIDPELFSERFSFVFKSAQMHKPVHAHYEIV